MNIDTTALYVCLDDLCKLYKSALKQRAISYKSGNKEGYLSLSEMLFIEIFYHFSPYKDFKHYYLYGIINEHRDKFGKLLCYRRFVSLKKQL